MIYKGKISTTNNVQIIEFGDGSTEMQAGYNPETKYILFKTCPPGDIKISAATVNNSDDFEPEVAFVFKNRESFELVFNYMTVIKNLYITDDIKK